MSSRVAKVPCVVIDQPVRHPSDWASVSCVWIAAGAVNPGGDAGDHSARHLPPSVSASVGPVFAPVRARTLSNTIDSRAASVIAW